MTEFFAGFGLRDWLLVLGPLLIIGILIHGYWRMRVNRNSLKMRLDKSFVSDLNENGAGEDELSLLRAELPNGGARVLSPTEQTSLNLDDDVPVLMNVAADQRAEEPSANKEPSAGKEPSADKEPSAHETPSASDAPVTNQQPEAHTPAGRDEAAAESEASGQQSRKSADLIEPMSPLPDSLPEKYVVINVMAVNGVFQGEELLECLLAQNMTLGEMSIFHRLQGDKTLFSLMNAVEPGSFDMATIKSIETPAISMFMRVHELHYPIRVFQQMLEVAAYIAEHLGGEVRDETRSVMTPQTIEHCRQQLQDYILKHHPQ
jgi:cell division protein ZipA